MSKEQIVARMQSALSGVNVGRIVKKQLTRAEIDTISTKCIALETAPLYIDDTAAISLIELKTKARKLVRENGVELIVIDYIQLMKSGLNLQVREQEISEISRGLKGLAKELNIPIIGLSQLSRAVEQREGKKPQLSDLRESGSLEQDSDIVMFCYRPIYYGIQEYEIAGKTLATDDLYMIVVGKHRNGETGEIPLQLIKEQTLLKNHPAFIFSAPSSNDFEPVAPMKRNTEFDDFDNNDIPF
jgi:replicative DNA helicase